MTIGDRLKELRLNAGYSQKEVAERLKLSKPIISQYESNLRKPSLSKLIMFSRFYKTSLDYICGNIDKKGNFVNIDVTINEDEQ